MWSQKFGGSVRFEPGFRIKVHFRAIRFAFTVSVCNFGSGFPLGSEPILLTLTIYVPPNAILLAVKRFLLLPLESDRFWLCHYRTYKMPISGIKLFFNVIGRFSRRLTAFYGVSNGPSPSGTRKIGGGGDGNRTRESYLVRIRLASGWKTRRVKSRLFKWIVKKPYGCHSGRGTYNEGLTLGPN